MAKNTPFYTAIGNHELYSDPLPRNYRDVYGLPVNSADGTEDYYSFDYGCVHFISLDTEMLSCGTAGHIDPVRAAQMNAWLEADLIASADKPWTVVFYHRPINFSCVSAAWRSLFEQYDVDIVFQGHTHIYSHSVQGGVHYVITGGGGAEIPANQYFHFCQVDASVYELKVDVYDINDTRRTGFSISSGVAVIPGDANKDGIVDDMDASILAAHWQQTGMSWDHGDFTGDGVVNDEDASVLAAHWQETVEGGAPVPEPGMLALLAGVLLSLLVWRRR